MSEKYKIGDSHRPHLIASTVVEGIVWSAEDYIYSRASYYYAKKDCLLEIDASLTRREISQALQKRGSVSRMSNYYAQAFRNIN